MYTFPRISHIEPVIQADVAERARQNKKPLQSRIAGVSIKAWQ